MIDIQTQSSEAIQQFARELFTTRHHQPGTFEAKAQYAAERIYQDMVGSDHQPLFALVRIFRSCQHDELPPGFISQMANNRDYWFALAGSAGAEPDWNDRLKSKNHAVIDYTHNLMFRQVLADLGLRPGETEVSPNVGGGRGFLGRYFYVENAVGNPVITDQEQFVKPYGIVSSVGFGGVFLSNAIYVILAFARQHIDRPTAEKFIGIAPFVATLLASPDGKGQLWNT